MSEILNKTEGAMQKIGKDAYDRVMSSATPNLFGLNQMLKERSQYYSERLNDYKYLIKKFDNPSIIIGRRGQDIVREMTLDTLEEGFLKGNPTAFTETKLVDRILNSPKAVKFADRATAETAMKQFHSTVVDKIPLFHEDGEAKFMLQVRSGGEDGEYRGKFQAWSAEKYADLVAITTAAEADVAANLDQAREIGTRIVKWNSTGKGREFYMRIGDTRCARVDGQYASLEPEGTTINGVFYPYYKSPERLPGRFNTCHPNCRHRLTPVPEEVLDLEQVKGLRDHEVPERQAVKYDPLTATPKPPARDEISLQETIGVAKASNADEARSLRNKLPMQPIGARQSKVLEDYKGNGYRLMNRYLREFETMGPNPRMDRDIAHMDDMIAMNTLPRPFQLYRGLEVAKIRKEIVGKLDSISMQNPHIIDNAGFASSSLLLDKAMNFAQRYPETGIVIDFIALKGTNYVKGTTYEHELVLPRGKKFSVFEAKMQGAILFVKAVMI
jgi:hypothetical protein